jgi:hypothetical protein
MAYANVELLVGLVFFSIRASHVVTLCLVVRRAGCGARTDPGNLSLLRLCGSLVVGLGIRR